LSKKGNTNNSPNIKTMEKTFFFRSNGTTNNNKGIYIAAAENLAIPNGEQVINAERDKIKYTRVLLDLEEI
jgi:hypothetical protein